MINRVVLVGRITKDPVMRKTATGSSVVSFTLACNRRFSSQGQDADFISCVAWNKIADVLENYVIKGMLLGIEGKIQTRSYDDKDKKRVYVTEVVIDSLNLLENKKDRQERQLSNAHSAALDSASLPPAHISEQDVVEITEDLSDISTDDLPF